MAQQTQRAMDVITQKTIHPELIPGQLTQWLLVLGKHPPSKQHGSAAVVHSKSLPSKEQVSHARVKELNRVKRAKKVEVVILF